MFSGIRSLLLGFTGSANTDQNVNQSVTSTENIYDTSLNKPDQEREKTISDATSILNAATTILTEQLIAPTRPTIEQLQASSHQLLPSLTEQQEQKAKSEALKNPNDKLIEGGIANRYVVDPALDDDGLDDESWELLDYNENNPIGIPVEASALFQQKDATLTESIDKSIVQPEAETNLSEENEGNVTTSKVSSEKSDLVIVAAETEEPAKRGAQADAPQRSNQRKRNRNRKRKIGASETQKQAQIHEACDKFEATIEAVKPVTVSSNPRSLNNYAEILKKGPKGNKENELEKVESSDISSQSLESTERSWEVKMSSSDEEISEAESSETDGKGIVTLASSNAQEVLKSALENTDNVDRSICATKQEIDNFSMTSSNHSDFDACIDPLFYGQVQLRSRHKKRGPFFMRKSPRCKRRSIIRASKPTQPGVSGLSGGRPVTPARAIIDDIPLDDIIYVSHPSCQGCKDRQEFIGEDDLSKPIFGKSKVAQTESPTSERADLSTSLMPPSIMQHSSVGQLTNCSGNDSSDVAEMDESWYVTPPPCFTGSRSQNFAQPKAKEDARENALIEHPSIYIAQTMQKDIKKSLDKPADTATTSSKNASDSKDRSGISASPCSSSPVSSSSKVSDSSMDSLMKSDMRRQGSWYNFDSDSDSDEADSDLVEEEPTKEVNESKPVRREVWDETFEIHGWDEEEEDDVDGFDVMFEDTKVSSPAIESIPSDDDSLEFEQVPTVEKSNASEFSSMERPQKSPEIAHAGSKKSPTQVRPLQPERQPAWQLRRKRVNRRSISGSSSTSMVSKKQKASGSNARSLSSESHKNETSEASLAPKACSSPTSIIDRIGSSIFSNLTNLASGFSSQPNCCIHLDSSIASGVKPKLTSDSSSLSLKSNHPATRKQTSQNQMSRHNASIKASNTNRRQDRRKKMHSHINGVSVNRKVQTNFRKV